MNINAKSFSKKKEKQFVIQLILKKLKNFQQLDFMTNLLNVGKHGTWKYPRSMSFSHSE